MERKINPIAKNMNKFNKPRSFAKKKGKGSYRRVKKVNDQ